MTKRTRRVKDFKIHLPFISIREPGVYHIYIKSPSVVIEKVGEIKRGRSDAEERGESVGV